ncbi:two-component system response regulator [Streptomyces sp. NPDC056352]|uniref:response regulator n=1 Tax=Streptomyces sp. NPDC056352 TaxID=3345791 RepID=UPI0035DE592A
MTINTPDKASILIVDDMEENLVALEAVLGSLDQQLVRAHSGEEALKAMLRQEFAVVLLDVLMPGMDGFETAANIKRLDQTKDVPIILLTGTEADTDYLYRGYAIGVADFLTKPFDPWLLRTKVNVFLDLYRKNRQLAAQAEQLRRLLVGAPTPAAPVGPARSVEPMGGARDRPSRARDAGAGVSASAGSGQQLTEITERLAQIELQLRDAEGAEAVGLADRIADLERTVRSLRAGRDAY